MKMLLKIIKNIKTFLIRIHKINSNMFTIAAGLTNRLFKGKVKNKLLQIALHVFFTLPIYLGMLMVSIGLLLFNVWLDIYETVFAALINHLFETKKWIKMRKLILIAMPILMDALYCMIKEMWEKLKNFRIFSLNIVDFLFIIFIIYLIILTLDANVVN